MIGDILQPTHLLFVLVVALLVLGPKRLPEVGRALGRTMRDFRSAISGEDTHDPAITETVATTPVVTNPAPADSAAEHPTAVTAEPPAAAPPAAAPPAPAPPAAEPAEAPTERQPTAAK